MRALKLVGIVVGGLVVLLILLLLAVRLFVNPNDYKDRIAQQGKASTGRELTLSGPIKLSVFPWIALELGPLSLGNPPGFPAQPFAAVQHIVLAVILGQEPAGNRRDPEQIEVRVVDHRAFNRCGIAAARWGDNRSPVRLGGGFG